MSRKVTCSPLCFFRQDCSGCLMKSSSFSLWWRRPQHRRPTPSTNAMRPLPPGVQSYSSTQKKKISTVPVESKVCYYAYMHTLWYLNKILVILYNNRRVSDMWHPVSMNSPHLTLPYPLVIHWVIQWCECRCKLITFSCLLMSLSWVNNPHSGRKNEAVETESLTNQLLSILR